MIVMDNHPKGILTFIGIISSVRSVGSFPLLPICRESWSKENEAPPYFKLQGENQRAATKNKHHSRFITILYIPLDAGIELVEHGVCSDALGTELTVKLVSITNIPSKEQRGYVYIYVCICKLTCSRPCSG